MVPGSIEENALNLFKAISAFLAFGSVLITGFSVVRDALALSAQRD